MSKISIDIESIKNSLESIGYIISDCIERDNNGLNWQIKFNNSGAIVTVYDTNNKKNSVVNGKCEAGEQEALKEIVDGLKCKEITFDPINAEIVTSINSHKEDSYYDFKQEWYLSGKEGDFLHDILCLANNAENKDAYLIVGVADNYDVFGVSDWKKSNEVFDFLRSKKFAGGKIPNIELRKIYYKYLKIDVLVIHRSNDVPYYLSEKYRGVGTQIYTRIGDTNTPKTETASYSIIEQLWKIHFEAK